MFLTGQTRSVEQLIELVESRTLPQTGPSPSDWGASTEIEVKHECSVVAQLITPTMIYATPMVGNAGQWGNQVRMQKGLVDPETIVAVR